MRGVEDGKAFQLGMNNVVTAYDLMLIYENLVDYKFVNERLTSEMIKILLQQKHNSRIPAKLPTEVKVAHKTGSITGVGHDSGIVFLPDGRKYILVLLSKNAKDEKAVIEAQADISRIIYDYVVQDIIKVSGETGIRTLGSVKRTLVFETSLFNHSSISPKHNYLKNLS